MESNQWVVVVVGGSSMAKRFVNVDGVYDNYREAFNAAARLRAERRRTAPTNPLYISVHVVPVWDEG